jgi:thioredoxin reductase/NAD-dependent dihydropyrimidine dehydrogenase PreA subunit
MLVDSSWLLALGPPALLGLALATLALRRRELGLTAHRIHERADAKATGSHEARLRHPHIDLDACIGCGTCVSACPEEGVLALVHGQAQVVHGARCVGHGLCAAACPVGAVALTLGDTSNRRDLPALDEDLQAVRTDGLYIAGELSGFALVRTAIEQGSKVAEAVCRRSAEVRVAATSTSRERRAEDHGGGVAVMVDAEPLPSETTELIVIGAGPAGLACALRAKELGRRSVVIEQEEKIGGAIASYPRRKLVMTQPVNLPLHGRLPRLSYSKEELIEVFSRVVVEHALDVRTNTRVESVTADRDGWLVTTTRGSFRAKNVCLALGRRGTPRKLGIPGEELTKVQYSLLDAAEFTGERVLVVGGGDSAIEAALQLAEQPGTEVTLSYRKSAFFRLKAKNDSAIKHAMKSGAVRVLFDSEPTRIDVSSASIRVGSDVRTLSNDRVLIFAGGVPPFRLLENAGVSFDPVDRPVVATADSGGGRGLSIALTVAMLLSAGLLGLRIGFADYFSLDPAQRLDHPAHALLSPRGGFGLWLGVAAAGLMAANLAYLIRRNPRFGQRLPGSLRAWMNVHVVTGIAALLLVIAHAGFAPKDTSGGHALLALAIVVCTGAIGRWLYAFVPRATNGRELAIHELQGQIGAIATEWDRDGQGFGNEIRRRVESLVQQDRARWRRGFVARIIAIERSRAELRRSLDGLLRQGIAQGMPPAEARRMLFLSRRAHQLLMSYAHFEEVRAVLGSWRYLHRWLALLMILLVGLHVRVAIRYGGLDWSGALRAIGWVGGVGSDLPMEAR